MHKIQVIGGIAHAVATQVVSCTGTAKTLSDLGVTVTIGDKTSPLGNFSKAIYALVTVEQADIRYGYGTGVSSGTGVGHKLAIDDAVALQGESEVKYARFMTASPSQSGNLQVSVMF